MSQRAALFHPGIDALHIPDQQVKAAIQKLQSGHFDLRDAAEYAFTLGKTVQRSSCCTPKKGDRRSAQTWNHSELGPIVVSTSDSGWILVGPESEVAELQPFGAKFSTQNSVHDKQVDILLEVA